MSAVLKAEVPFNWKDPNYLPIIEERAARLLHLRKNPEIWAGIKGVYKDDPVKFVNDWGWTVDPRNAELGREVMVPFVLFPRQEKYLQWLYDRWRGREDGLVEKSRDMGVTWLCVAFGVWMWLFHAGTVVGFGSRKEEYVDKLGDPKSIFWKVRQYVALLPEELRPEGYKESAHAPFMRVLNPENGAAIVGEAGDNIGRGNRTSIYFKDESAFYEHADAIDAALSQTSNCKIDVSTPNGTGNPFYRKRHGGRIHVFIFDWRDDPRKDAAWYEEQKDKLDAVIVAQEIDRDYEGSVGDAWFPGALVTAAQGRGPADVEPIGPLMVGVDVARFGDDKCVTTFRRGRVVIRQVRREKLDVMQCASWVREEIRVMDAKPDQIAVDTIGIGAGVADILRSHGWFPDTVSRDGKVRKTVVDVNAGLRLDDGQNYNLRARMARQVKEWLPGASLPADPDLKSGMTAMKYFFRGGLLLLESKDEMKSRGMKSPDEYDSLALTFAIPIVEKKAPPKTDPFVPAVAGTGM